MQLTISASGKKIYLGATLLVAACLFWLIWPPGVQIDLPRSVVGQPAANFTATEIGGGRTVSLEAFRGKVVLLNFWASWCDRCLDEHANLLDLQRAHGGNADFVMLGVAYRDRPEDARAFLSRWGAAYPQLADPDGSIGDRYGISAVPQSFLIDRDGIVRCRHFGPLLEADIARVTSVWLAPALAGGVPASCN